MRNTALYPYHNASTIIEVLRSITALELESDGCLVVGFDNETDRSSMRSFAYGTFTRNLLILIEAELHKESV